MSAPRPHPFRQALQRASADNARVGEVSRPGRGPLRAGLMMGAAVVLLPEGAYGQVVATAGGPTTVRGPATDQVVTTSQASGKVALNRFDQFLQTATTDRTTLVLPTGTDTLVNMVSGKAAAEVRGTVTSRLGSETGAVGGHVVFAAPGGMLVANGAKLNVGRLSVVSASKSAIEDAVLDGSSLRSDAVDRLLGTDTADGGAITINGTVTAPGGAAFRAPTITIGATGLVRTAGDAATGLLTDTLVNTAALTAASGLVVGGDGSVTLTGTAVTLESGAAILARTESLDTGYLAGGVTVTAPVFSAGSSSQIAAWNDTLKRGGTVKIVAKQENNGLGGLTALGGMPDATTSVTLNGTIDAAAIDVSALSIATTRAPKYDMPLFDIGLVAANYGIAQLEALAGVSAAVAIAQGKATVDVGTAAVLSARGGDLSLVARTEAGAVADPSKLPLYAPGTGTLSPIGAGFVFTKLNAETHVAVAADAALSATGSATLSATNVVENIAKASAYARGEGSVAFAAGIALSDVKADVTLGKGASIDSAGAVTTLARNQAAFELDVAAKTIENGRAGGAVAIAIQDMAANVTIDGRIGADAARAGSVSIRAESDISRNTQSASAIAATGLVDRAVAPITDAAYQKISDKLAGGFIGRGLPGRKVVELPTEADPASALTGVLSLVMSGHTANATLGAGASLYATGAADIAAVTRDGVRLDTTPNSGDGLIRNNATSRTATARDIDGVSRSFSAAIGVTITDLGAVATVGEGAAVNSGKLNVTTDVQRVYAEDWTTEAPDASIDGVKKFLTNVASKGATDLGLTEGFLTNSAGAVAASEGSSAISGSVAVSNVDSESRAWIDSAAKVTAFDADRTTGDRQAAVVVDARTVLEGVQMAGPINLTGLGADGGRGSTGAGGAAAISLWNPTTIAGIGDGAKVDARAGSVAVNADTRVKAILIAPLSGSGGGVGFSGTAAVDVLRGTNRASISNAATVSALGGVSVIANSDLLMWGAAGTLAMSSGSTTGGTAGAVGVGAAVNVVLLDNDALIGDNNADDYTGDGDATDDVAAGGADGDANAIGARALAGSGAVSTDNAVRVAATGTGQIGALAVAGSYAGSSDGDPGIVDKIKGKLKLDKLGDAVTALKESALTGLTDALGVVALGARDLGSPAPTGTQVGPNSGFAVAGSATVNYTEFATSALLDAAHIKGLDTTKSAGTLTVSALNDVDLISVTGGAAVSKQSGPAVERSTTLSGAFGVQYTANSASARISDSLVEGKDAVEVGAFTRGLRVAAGLSLSADISKASKVTAASGSVSYADARDTALAEIVDSRVLGGTAEGADRVVVSALNAIRIGAGAIGITIGGTTGVGAAVSAINASGTSDAKSAEAAIRNSIVRNVADTAVVAKNKAFAVTVGAVGAGSGSKDSDIFVGAATVNNIDMDALAELTVGDAADGAAAVVLLGTLLVQAGERDVAAPFVVPGAATRSEGISSAWDSAVDVGVGDLGLDSTDIALGKSDFDIDAGARVIGIAGAIGVSAGGGGSTAAGLTVAFNRIDNDNLARVRGVGAASKLGIGGLEVRATDEADILAISSGVAISTGKFAGMGSVTTNFVSGSARADLSSDAGAGRLAVTVAPGGDVAVTGKTSADIWSFAGNLALSAKNAVGAAVAVNEVRTDAGATPGASARVVDVDLKASNDVSVLADADGAVKSGAGALAGGGGKIAIAGAATANRIGAAVNAEVSNATIAAVTGGAKPSLTIQSAARGTIDSLAASLGAALGGTGVGAAIAVNRVDPTVTAAFRGGSLVGQAITVSADSTASIRTLASGVGGGSQAGGAGSVAVNVIGTSVDSRIAGGADVRVDDNALVLANQVNSVDLAAGALGIGAGSAGIGLSFTVNSIEGDTVAAIGDANDARTTVSALGKGAVDQVRGGDLVTAPAEDNSLEAFKTISFDQEAHDVRGVEVNAASGTRSRTFAIAGGGGATFGLGVVGNVDVIGGDTIAKVENADAGVRKADLAAANAASGLDVRASSHKVAAAAVGAAAASGSAAIGGAAAATVITGETKAYLDHATALTGASGAVNVVAHGSQTAGVLAAGAAGGEGAAGLAAAAVVFKGDYSARIGESDVTADAVSVDASGRAGVIAGGVGLAGGGVAGGGGLVVVVNSNTVESELLGSTTTKTTIDARTADVTAASSIDLGAYAAAGAVGAGAGAGAGIVVVQDGSTRARAVNATVGYKGGASERFTLDAAERLRLNAAGGAAAIGGGSAGVGLGLTVVSAQSDVVAEVVDSQIEADTANIHARTDAAVDSLLVSAGLGLYAGISAAVSYLQFGSGESGDFYTNPQIGGNGSSNGSLDNLTSRTPDGSAILGAAPLDDTDRTRLDAVMSTASTGVGEISRPKAHQVVASIRDTGAGKTMLTVDDLDVAADVAVVAIGRAPNVAAGAAAVAGTANIVRVYTNAEASAGYGTTINARNVSFSARADEQPADAATPVEPDGGPLDLLYPTAPHRAAEAYSVLGSVGAGAAAVAVSDAKVATDLRAVALGKIIGSGTGTLAINASDTTEVAAQTVAVQGSLAGINGSAATAAKESQVNAALGGGTTGFDKITISANEAGRAEARSLAGSGGVFGSGDASTAIAINKATVGALIAENARIATGAGGVTLSATGSPYAHADSAAVTVSLGASLGAAIAHARVTPTITARVGEGADLSGDGGLDVIAKLVLPTDGVSADAKATAGTGGLLVGLNGTSVSATNAATVRALIGADLDNYASGAAVKLPRGAVTILADRTTRQTANSLGIAVGGALSVGAHFADATSSGESTAELGIVEASNGRDGALSIKALTDDTDEAQVVAGSGGLVAGAAALATTTGSTNTTARYAAPSLSATSFELVARNRTTLAGGANAVNAAAVGASGGETRNTVTGTTLAEIVAGAAIAANSIAVQALSNPVFGNGSDGYAAQGGAGGLFNGAGAAAYNVVDIDTIARIGDGALLVQRVAATDDPFFNDLGVRISAGTQLAGNQQVRLDAYGLIQVPLGRIETDATLDTTTSLGKGARIDAQRGVGLGSYATSILSGLAVTKVYGGASYGEAVVDAFVTANQQTLIGEGASVTTLGDVRIAAGADADGSTQNLFSNRSNAEVFNYTAIPLNTEAGVVSRADVGNLVQLDKSAVIAAGRDVFLSSTTTGNALTATGTGHNPYLEAIGTQETTGTPEWNASGTLRLAGASVTAGAFADRSLVFDTAADGSTRVTTRGVTLTDPLSLSYVGVDTLASIDIAKGIDDELARLVLASKAGDPAADAQIEQLSQIRQFIATGAKDAILLGPIFAASGDVSVDAAKIEATAASSFTANGKASVAIDNQTGRSLVLGRIFVPMTGGGDILATGAAVDGVANLSLARLNKDATGEVRVTSGVMGSSTAPRADVIVNDRLTNVGGSADIRVANGALIQLAAVEAGAYSADVPNGPLIASDPSQNWVKDVPINLWYGKAGIALDRLGAETGVEYAASRLGISDYNWAGSTVNANWLSEGTGDNISVVWLSDSNGVLFDRDNIYGNQGYGVKYPASSGYQGGTVYSRAIQFRSPDFTATGAVAAAPSDTVVRAQTLLINANWVNLSGKIEVGTQNQKSVRILGAADAYVQQMLANNPLATEIDVPSYAFSGFIVKPLLQQIAAGDAPVSVRFVRPAGGSFADGYYVVDSVAASGGGFASITGKIANTNSAGTANITILDGLGDVRIDNQTGRKLVVGDVNVGKSAVGTLVITDKNYATPLRTEYRHVRGEGVTVTRSQGGVTLDVTNISGDATNYTPMSGIRYNWSEQRNLTRTTNILDPDSGFTSMRASAWTWSAYNAPSTGTFDFGTTWGTAGSAEFEQHVEAAGYTKDGVRFDFNSGGSNQFYWTIRAPTSTGLNVKSSIRADHQVGISFVGANAGRVDVKSVGDLSLSGRITNPLGTSSFVSGGRLDQVIGSAVDTGGLVLASGTGIGAADNPFAMRLGNGSLDVTSNGSINLALTGTGNTAIKQVVAGGDVTLVAGGSLLRAADAAAIQVSGNKVTLLAERGGIGTAAASLVINAGTTTGELNALARDGVYLDQSVGDLRVGRIEATAGDVRLSAAGAIVAAAPSGAIDAGEVQRLAAVWDAADIREGDAAKAAAVAVNAIEGKFQRDYAEYRQLVAGVGSDGTIVDAALRGALKERATASVTADLRLLDEVRANASIAPDGTVTLTAAGAATFRTLAQSRLGRRANASGALTTDEIAAQVGAYYYEIAARIDAVFGSVPPSGGAVVLSDAGVDAYAAQRVGALRGGFADLFGATLPFDGTTDYTLDIVPGTALYDRFTRGATWKDGWLDVVISKNALTPVANTQFLRAEPQVVGRTVTLKAGGAIGASDAPISFVVSPSAVLTDLQKAALIAAGPGDVVEAAAAGGGRALTVNRDRLLQVRATQAVSAEAGANLFIGAQGDLTLSGIAAPGAIRLVASGDVLSQTGTLTAISGGALRIEASGGAIGSAATPVLTDVASLQVARAAGDLYLAAKNDLLLGNLFAGGTAVLTANNGSIRSIFANDDVLHVQAERLSFVAARGIGEMLNPLRITSGAGGVSAASAAGDVALRAPAGLLSVTAASGDDVWLSSNDALTITGPIAATGRVTLDAGGAMTLAPGAAIDGKDATITAASVAGENARVTLTGTATVKTTGGVNLANFRAGGALLIDAAGGVVLTDAEGGTATVLAGLDATLLRVRAAQTLNVVAGGAADLRAVASGDDLYVRARGNASIANAVAGAIDAQAGLALDADSVTTTGDAHFTAGTDVALDDLAIAGNLAVAAPGRLTLRTAVIAGGAALAGDQLLAQALSARTLDAQAAKIAALDGLRVAGPATLAAGEALVVRDAVITGPLDARSGMTATLANVQVGAASTLSSGERLDVSDVVVSGNAQLNAAEISASGLDAGSLVVASTRDATLNGVRVAADASLRAGRNLTLRDGSVGGTLVGTGGGTIDAAGLTVGGNASLSAASLAVNRLSANAVRLVAIDDATIDNLDTRGDATLSAENALTLHAIRSAGAIEAHAGGALIGDDLHAANAIRIDGKTVNVQDLTAGALQVSAQRQAFIDGGAVVGAASLTSGGPLSVKNLRVGDRLDATAGDLLDVAMLDVGGTAQLSGGSITARGLSAGATTLTALRGITLGDARIAHDAALSTGTELSIERTTIGGTLAADAAGALTADTVSIAGSAMLRADSATVRATSAGSLNLAAVRDASIDGLIVAGAADLATGSTLVIRDVTASDLAAHAGAALTVDDAAVARAATMSGASVTARHIDAGSLRADAVAGASFDDALIRGDATIVAGRALDLRDVAANGALDARAGGDITIAGTVSANTVTLRTADALRLFDAARLTAAGAMRATALGEQVMARGSAITAGGALVIDVSRLTMERDAALGAATLEIDADGDATLGLVSVSGDTRIGAGDARFQAATTIGGALDLTSGGAMGVDDGVVVRVYRGARLGIGTLTLGRDALLATDEELSIVAQRDAQIGGGLRAGRDIDIRAGGAVTLDGAGMAAGGSLRMGASRLGARYTSSITTGRDLDIDVTGDTDLGLVEAGRDVRISTGGSLRMASAMRAGGSIDTQAGGDVSAAADLAAGTALNVAAGGDLSAAGALRAGGAAWLAAGGDVTVQDGGSLAAADTIIAAGGSVTTTGAEIAARDNLALDAGGNVALGAVEAAGAATIGAGGSADISDLRAQSLRIAAGGAVTQTGKVDVVDTATISGQRFAMGRDASIEADRIALRTAADAVIGAVAARAANGEAVAIDAGAQVLATDAANAAIATRGGNVRIAAGGDVGAADRALTVAAPALALSSTAGSAWIASPGSMALSVTLPRGKLSYSGAGALTLSGAIAGQTDTSVGGPLRISSLSVGSATLAATGGIAIDRMTTAGALAFATPDLWAGRITSVSGAPLTLSVVGAAANNMATRVRLDQVDAAGGLRFATLMAADVAVRTDAVMLTVDGGAVGALHAFVTPAASLLLSRDPTINVGFDFQLYDLRPEYSLRLAARDLFTGTPVVTTLPNTRSFDMAGTPTTDVVTTTQRIDRAPAEAANGAVSSVTPQGASVVTVAAGGGVNADEDISADGIQ